MIVILAAVELITLHMIDGRTIQINPMQITQMVHPPTDGGHNRQISDEVKCVVRLVDGSFVSVEETCEDVQKALRK